MSVTNEQAVRRIAVVDDDDAVREGAAIVLETDGRVIDAFPRGEDFLRAAEGEGWDVVFLDLKMPGLTGFDVLRRLSESQGSLPFPVVMISAHGDVQAAVQAMRLGASGFVEKPFTPEALEEAIEDVTQTDDGERPARETLLSKLTPRERDVAALLDEGLTNKEVAAKLGCSPRTIEIHRARVFEKLDVRNVAGLVRALTGRG